MIDAILSDENKRIALRYVEWAGTPYQRTVIDWTLIDSEAAAQGCDHPAAGFGDFGASFA